MASGVTPGTGSEVHVLDDAGAVAEAGAALLAGTVKETTREGGMVRIALSGGHTPAAMYDQLASSPTFGDVPWDRVQIFFSDERFVPLDSPDSNFRLARDRLLTRVLIPERFVHPVPTEGVSQEEAASMYEEGIRRVFEAGLHEVPRFDLIFLGLGGDGHTASLFPGTPPLNITDRLVVPNTAPVPPASRITFTYPLLDAARTVAFLVQGADKADTVAEVLSGGSNLPAARVQASRLIWLLDRAAASKYSSPTQSAEQA